MADWRVGTHYNIHNYEGDRPVATFFRSEDAQCAVTHHNEAHRLITKKEKIVEFEQMVEDAKRIILDTMQLLTSPSMAFRLHHMERVTAEMLRLWLGDCINPLQYKLIKYWIVLRGE